MVEDHSRGLFAITYQIGNLLKNNNVVKNESSLLKCAVARLSHG